jgi:hypothetical protein
MSERIETDYLVMGAGAAGMAITDALLVHCPDAQITLVDRRHAPGGHWWDAYPYVRLHQPSAFYGVASQPLGLDRVDRGGLNAGFYELARADELRAYYAQVMQEHFLPSGRVRYLPLSDGVPGPQRTHHLRSRLSGARCDVHVRRKLVDTTYLEGEVPATHAPPFEVADGVRWVAAGALACLPEPAERFVIVGAGKTALDAIVWLLTQGVPADAIRWIKPREGWWLNRRLHQPLAGLPDFYAGVGLQLQAMAEAQSVDDVFARLEAAGFFLRVDTGVAPTMCHGAIVGEAELALLRRVTDVVRLGHVRRIERDRIVLDHGTVPTDARALHVHCAARGLARPAPRPIFAPGRLTVQPLFWGFACLQFALLGVVEALVEGDDEKNRLCPPIAYWDRNVDYLVAYLAALTSERARAAHPALAAWARQTRLNPLGRIGEYREHPTVIEARERIRRYGAAAALRLPALLAAAA